MMKKIVVVGGGISGTAAAWTAAREASKLGVPVQITLLERDATLGGKAKTVAADGWLVETGPLGFLGTEPAVKDLAEEAGVADTITPANAAAARRYIVRDGVMKEVPGNPLRFLFSGHISPMATLRILGEPFVRTPAASSDETIGEFCARRFGRQVADRLVHPMVLGVFAGDSSQLSMRSSFPLFSELEEQHGSVIKGFLARAREKKKNGSGEKPERGLRTFSDGIQSLPVALANRGSFDVRTGCEVQAIDPREGGGWSVAVGDERLEADAVIATCESFAAAGMIESHQPELAAELNAIVYPPVAVVALGYTGSDAARIPNGFGVLIPRDDRYRMLGVTWDSRVFPGRCPDGSVLVRVMLGGSYDPEIGSLDQDELAGIARKEASRLLGVSNRPAFVLPRLWSRAIPQYEVGHGERIARIEGLLERAPGLFMGGNALYGSSFGKSATRAVAVGREVVEWLRRGEG